MKSDIDGKSSRIWDLGFSRDFNKERFVGEFNIYPVNKKSRFTLMHIHIITTVEFENNDQSDDDYSIIQFNYVYWYVIKSQINSSDINVEERMAKFK